MEVHAHTHTERKKWTHYLWEFLMLFLALTLGFFVENQREHYVEHQREKQFVQSLVNDIRLDTARINRIITIRIFREVRLDSISWWLNNEERDEHSSDIYFSAVTASRTLTFRFVPNDGTIQQLKNSGALRLIRNPAAVDSIAKYDVSVRNFVRQGELEEILVDSYRTAASKIFDALQFDKMLDTDNNVTGKLPDNPPLLNFNEDDLHNFNFRLYSMKGLNKANRRDARLLLKQAENLLGLLEKEYHLK